MRCRVVSCVGRARGNFADAGGPPTGPSQALRRRCSCARCRTSCSSRYRRYSTILAGSAASTRCTPPSAPPLPSSTSLSRRATTSRGVPSASAANPYSRPASTNSRRSRLAACHSPLPTNTLGGHFTTANTLGGQELITLDSDGASAATAKTHARTTAAAATKMGSAVISQAPSGQGSGVGAGNECGPGG